MANLNVETLKKIVEGANFDGDLPSKQFGKEVKNIAFHILDVLTQKKIVERHFFEIVSNLEYLVTVADDDIYNAGYEEAYEEGKSDGVEEGRSQCYDEGYSDGYDDGKLEGYNEGFEDGKESIAHE